MRLALLTRLWTHLPSCVAESRQALDHYSGGDILDIGAFHGWYSVLLAPIARAGDRLVSFEPDPDAISQLRATLDDLDRHFPAVNLSLVTKPVGDGQPVAASWPMYGHVRFATAHEGATQQGLAVDDVVADRRLEPRLVKIDVEGAELFVLRGMRETLSAHRPAVILELHPSWQPDGVGAADVETLIRDSGYEGSTWEETPLCRRQVWLPR
jgi:FkbM family methyltransferase